ncbi:MAG: hypothetical protein E6J90_50550, partial [Deltaproteobacteria bacterium]
MSLLDGDPRRSAAHRNMAEHLAGPLRGGAAETPLVLALANGAWRTRVDWVSRQPLLLLELRAPLAEHGRVFTVEVTPDGGAAVTATLAFAPFTEDGAALPGWIAPPGPASDTAPPFSITVTATGLPAGVALGDVVAVRVVEGVLGRLLYAIGVEKARVRRQARELHELRRLGFRFDDTPEHRRMGAALDRLGAELGVPRFADRLAWDAANQRPTSVSAAEPDEAYRARLELYRPFLMPTPGRVLRMLRDYAGAAAVTVSEPNTEFAVAIQLVSSPDDAPRRDFLRWLRAAHLVQPGQPIPAARLLPRDVRAAQQAALGRVATAFAFPAGAVTRPWKVLRAQDDAGGSRYELGLGVELEVPPAAELDALVQALARKAFPAGTDPATLALLASVTAPPSAADPLGRWLLAACGAKTVHATATGCFVSHMPVFGAVLVPDGAPNAFQARFEAPGDPGPNAVLWYGMRDVTADAAAAGIPAWTELAAAPAAAARAAATVPPAPFVAALAAARLRTPGDAAELARAIAALGTMPAELMTTVKLAPALAAGLQTGAAAAAQQLAALVRLFVARELGSVLPLVSGGDVLLVIGVVPLPSAASLVKAERLAFRWYAVGMTGVAGTLTRSVGARSTYVPPAGVRLSPPRPGPTLPGPGPGPTLPGPGPGAPAAAPSLAAVVAVSLARADRDDPRDRIAPYSARVDLPDGALIDLATYERVMNLLERAAPIGVVLDTAPLRERHVDPGALGHA